MTVNYFYFKTFPPTWQGEDSWVGEPLPEFEGEAIKIIYEINHNK